MSVVHVIQFSWQGRQRESRFATGGSNWASLMASLSHLAVAEKFYYSLEFYKLCMQKKKEVGGLVHAFLLILFCRLERQATKAS